MNTIRQDDDFYMKWHTFHTLERIRRYNPPLYQRICPHKPRQLNECLQALKRLAELEPTAFERYLGGESVLREARSAVPASSQGAVVASICRRVGYAG